LTSKQPRRCGELASAPIDDETRAYRAPALADCLARLRIPELLAAA
jgi:hypothetical protein